MLDAWSRLTIEPLAAPAPPVIDWPPERTTLIDADGHQYRPKAAKAPPAKRPRIDVETVLATIQESGAVTSAQIAGRFNVTGTSAVRWLQRLRSTGQVRLVRQGRNECRYEVA